MTSVKSYGILLKDQRRAQCDSFFYQIINTLVSHLVLNSIRVLIKIARSLILQLCHQNDLHVRHSCNTGHHHCCQQ